MENRFHDTLEYTHNLLKIKSKKKKTWLVQKSCNDSTTKIYSYYQSKVCAYLLMLYYDYFSHTSIIIIVKISK